MIKMFFLLLYSFAIIFLFLMGVSLAITKCGDAGTVGIMACASVLIAMLVVTTIKDK